MEPVLMRISYPGLGSRKTTQSETTQSETIMIYSANP